MATISMPSATMSKGEGSTSPSTNDRSRHRPIIKRLYIDQRKKLREVMDIMARDYGFVASSKMYKVRIKQWGYSKNIRTTSEDVGSLVNTVSGTKGPVVLATGRVVDSQRLALHLRRKQESIVQTSRQAKWPPSPRPPSSSSLVK